MACNTSELANYVSDLQVNGAVAFFFKFIDVVISSIIFPIALMKYLYNSIAFNEIFHGYLFLRFYLVNVCEKKITEEPGKLPKAESKTSGIAVQTEFGSVEGVGADPTVPGQIPELPVSDAPILNVLPSAVPEVPVAEQPAAKSDARPTVSVEKRNLPRDANILHGTLINPRDCGGAGDCYYRSLADQMWGKTKDNWRDVRMELCAFGLGKLLAQVTKYCEFDQTNEAAKNLRRIISKGIAGGKVAPKLVGNAENEVKKLARDSSRQLDELTAFIFSSNGPNGVPKAGRSENNWRNDHDIVCYLKYFAHIVNAKGVYGGRDDGWFVAACYNRPVLNISSQSQSPAILFIPIGGKVIPLKVPITNPYHGFGDGKKSGEIYLAGSEILPQGFEYVEHGYIQDEKGNLTKNTGPIKRQMWDTDYVAVLEVLWENCRASHGEGADYPEFGQPNFFPLQLPSGKHGAPEVVEQVKNCQRRFNEIGDILFRHYASHAICTLNLGNYHWQAAELVPVEK